MFYEVHEMSTTFEAVLEKAKSLSRSEKARLISILSKPTSQTNGTANNRLERISAFQKRFRDVLPCTEEFLAEKRKEILIED